MADDFLPPDDAGEQPEHIRNIAKKIAQRRIVCPGEGQLGDDDVRLKLAMFDHAGERKNWLMFALMTRLIDDEQCGRFMKIFGLAEV